MSYSTGTISDATQPAKTFMDTIKTTIDNHAAWVFVEEVTSGNNVGQVFKCLGTVNSFGTDFYVYLLRTGLTSVTYVGLSENWDATNKKLQSPAPGILNGTAFTPTASNQFPTDRLLVTEGTNALTNGWLGAGLDGSTGGLGTNNGTTGFQYWLSVSNDRIVIAVRTNTNSAYGAYVGLFDSFHSTSLDGFPLVNISLGTSWLQSSGLFQFTSAHGAYTREPGVTTSTTFGWQAYASITPWTITKPDNGTSTSKEIISGKWWTSRVLLMGANRRSTVRGLMKSDCVLMDMLENAEAVGDTATIDGVTYTCFTSGGGAGSGNGLWVSQAA